MQLFAYMSRPSSAYPYSGDANNLLPLSAKHGDTGDSTKLGSYQLIWWGLNRARGRRADQAFGREKARQRQTAIRADGLSAALRELRRGAANRVRRWC